MADSLLGDILNTVNQQFKEIEGAKELVQTIQAGRKQAQQQLETAVSNAGISDGRGGRDTAITVQAEEMAALNAQNQTRKAATAMGSNMDDASEILTQLSSEVRSSAVNAIDKAKIVDEKASVGLLDNPIKYIYNQITMDHSIEEANAAKNRFVTADAALTRVQNLTQELPKTAAAIAATRSAATVESKITAVQSAVDANVARIKIENADKDIAGIGQLQAMSAQQIQALGTAYSAKNAAEHLAISKATLKLHQDEADRRTKEWNEKMEKKALDEQETKDLAGYVSNGLAQMGYKELATAPHSKIIQLLKLKDPIYMDALKIGMTAATTGKPGLSDDPAQVARVIVQHKVPLDPSQEKIKEIYKQAISDAANPAMAVKAGVDVSKMDQVTKYAGKLVSEKAAHQHGNIDHRDQSNIYAPPPIEAVVAIPAVANSNWYKEVLSSQVAGIKETNPELLIALTSDAVKAKKISYKDASQGLHVFFTASAGLNNVTRNYKGLGLPQQTAFNVSLDNSFGFKTKRNLMNPVDVDTALNTKLQSMAPKLSPYPLWNRDNDQFNGPGNK